MKEISRFTLLSDASRRFAACRADTVALAFEGRQVSYSELDALSDRIAFALLKDGVAPGERVIWLGKNSDLYFVLLFATAKIGAVLTPIGWRLAPAEAGYISDDSHARLVFIGPEGQRQFDDTAPLLRDAVIAIDSEAGSLEAWLNAATAMALPEVDQDWPVVQLYTSGTTGRPKGVMLSHRNFISAHRRGAEAGFDWAEWHDDDVSLVAMPVSHVGGTNWGLAGLLNGARSIIAREFDPNRVLDFIEIDRVSKLFIVPSALQIIVDDPRSRRVDYSRLKTILYGASPIPPALLRECMEVFGCGFCQNYGMTETTGTVVYLPPEAHSLEDQSKLTSVGIAMPETEVRVVDPEGRPVATGVVGEIVTRSVSNMVGYWHLPEETAKTIDAEGWLHTGDAGYFDPDGYLFLHDRIKDMIISGGENIYPSEVENAIYEHPGVAEAAVIGVPHPRWGEAVKAVVVRRPDAEVDEAAVIAFVRERIATFKAPKSVDFVDQLPRNASGKILRRELRAPYWA